MNAITLRSRTGLAVPQPDLTVTMRWADTLRDISDRQIAANEALPHRAEIESAYGELTAALQPARDLKLAKAAVVMLVASYPQKADLAGPYLDGMAAALAEELPADLIVETVRRVPREYTFVPAIAEVLKVGRSLMGDRRDMRLGAGKVLAEYRRIEREMAERRTQEAEARRAKDERMSRLATIWGVHLPPATSFDSADGIVRRFAPSLIHWYAALLAGSPWSIVAWRRAIVLSRAIELERAKRLGVDQVVDVAAYLAQDGEAEAEAIVAAGEHAAIEPSSFNPLGCTWDDVKVLAEVALAREACEQPAQERGIASVPAHERKASSTQFHEDQTA
jgi:hypothetical protein